MQWLRKLAEVSIVWFILRIVTFIAVGSAVATITGLILDNMAHGAAFSGIAVGLAQLPLETTLAALVATVSVWRILEMLYGWIERTIDEYFSDVRQVELTTADIKFIIGAVEEYQQLVGNDDAQKRRAGFMIGHLDHYCQ